MSLGDHWDDSTYLPEGWHSVTVKDFRNFEFTSGSPGVEFTVVAQSGRICKMEGFNLLPQCQYNLASFAKACGMTQEDARAYDPGQPDSHAMLVGRTVRVLVVKDGKYHKVEEWAPEDGSVMPSGVLQRPEESTPAGNGAPPPPSDDDIPF